MSSFRRITNTIADLVMAHTKIIMPIVLIVCVLLTVVIAINARDRAKTERSEETDGVAVTEEVDLPDMITIPELPLELNKYPEITALMLEYYQALADGDSIRASELCIDLGELEMIRIEEMAKYIDTHATIEVYTKDGLTDGSYVVYVVSWVRFHDVEALMPGMRTFYLKPDENGDLVIRKAQLDDNIIEYIRTVSLQDNVIDLYNKITVEFNDLIASDQELEEFVAFMTAKIDENVGVVLAQTVQPDITADQFRNDNGENDDENDTNGNDADDNQRTVSTTVIARATSVVNIRSSDSETADRVGRAIVGEEFTVIEQRGNGWSQIRYNNRDAFIKSEFLEVIGEIGGAAESVTISGRVKVTGSNVRVRSTASTSGQVLGTASTGDRFDFVETVSGWAKVIYNNQIGYIRNDFIEREP